MYISECAAIEERNDATYDRHGERFGVVVCDNGYQMQLVGCTVEKLLVRCQ